MEDLLKNDGLAQFIFNKYFKGQNLTTEEMLNKITSSVADFSNALDC